MASPFNILRESPHDLLSAKPEEKPAGPASQRWVPSRYTIRASTDDGRLILWNTFSGSMSVFKPEQKKLITSLIRKTGFAAERKGVVKYLSERGFLIPEGTNERRQLQVAIHQQHFRTDSLELILLSSEDCNFRCQYCYEKFARGTMEPWVQEAVKKLVEKRLPGLRHLNISWFGGEPLYGLSAIDNLAPFFVEKARERGITYSSSMTTNGYLLTPDVAERLLAWNITTYQITVDGPAESHDVNRPTRDGQGSFDVIFANLKALHERSEDFRVNLRVNYDQNNSPHLSRLLAAIEEDLGSDPRFRLHFHAVGRWGGDNDAQLQICGLDESQKVVHELSDEARRRGINIGNGLRDVNALGSEVCYAARPYNLIVGASGKLMKCTVMLDTSDANVVGQLSENGDTLLHADRFALWTEPAFENDTRCQKCVVLPLCQGTHCPMVRIEEDRSPCTPLRANLKRELVETEELNSRAARPLVIKKSELRTSA